MGESENIFSIKHLPAVNERVKQLVDFYANGSVKRFSEMIHLSSSQKLNRVFNLDKRNNVGILKQTIVQLKQESAGRVSDASNSTVADAV